MQKDMARHCGKLMLTAAKDPNTNNVLYSFDSTTDANGNPVLTKINLPAYLNSTQTMKTANTDWFKEITQNALFTVL
jgi:hypothetical protein